jgi:perosamine synthetase
MIPIYKPLLKTYKSSAIKAIESEWISNHGIYVDIATEKIKEVLGAKYCILMNNGTSATHCLFKALKFKYPSITKIYIPNNVFIAPWNCALLEYDKTQIEVMKLDKDTFNIVVEEEYIKSLESNSAVVIVHNLGNIVNVPRLKRIRSDVIFIEDNCEGLFGKYEDIYTGTSTASLCSAVSFYGNKTITTGEGGAFFTNDINIYKYIKTYFSHGMSEERYIHNLHGTNYRMTNLQAAFLYDQLNDIDNILSMKKLIISRYNTLLNDLITIGKVSIPSTEAHTEKSNWMFIIYIKGHSFSDFEKYMNEKNIQVRPLFYDIYKHEHLKDIIKHEHIVHEHIYSYAMLPSYPELTLDEQKYITTCIREFINIKV